MVGSFDTVATSNQQPATSNQQPARFKHQV